jgi:hypothetical protein
MRFHFLFWPLLLATLVVAFIQLKDKTYLESDTAPRGIVSLELGWSQTRDTSIIRSWKTDTLDLSSVTLCQQQPLPMNLLKKARFDVCLDYLFILLYTLLGVLVVTALQKRVRQGRHWFTYLLVALVLIAGALDCIENVGLLQYIEDGIHGRQTATPLTAFVTSTAAAIKFTLLFLLVCLYLPLTLIFRDNGLQLLSDYIRDKTFQVFRYRVLLIGLALFCLPIWVMDQGQDLLININSSDQGVLLFMIVILAAALLNWWLAKLFFGNKALTPVFPFKELPVSDPEAEKAEKKASRYLGVCTILIPAVAILNALQVIRVHSWMDILPSALWLVFNLTLFFVLIKYDIVCRLYGLMEKRIGLTKSRNIVLLILVLLGVVLPLLIRLSAIRGESDTPHSLIYLFWHLLLLAFSFLLFVSVRTNIFPEESIAGSRIGGPIVGMSVLLAVLFIVFTICPSVTLSLDCNYLSLPVLLSGIILYILLLTWLIRISLLKKINFALLLIAAAILISIGVDNEYHSVKLMDIKAPAAVLPLDDYFSQWLLKRKEEIKRSTTYPVFLVNSYGGGIKAASFTNMAVTYLDSVLIASGQKGFEHYVFSFSGASGGTVGAAVQCAYRARYLDSGGQYSSERWNQFYHHDFLTPVLGAMFGRDVWASVTGQHSWDDRAAIQAGIWEGFGRKTLGLDLSVPFDELWDTSVTNPGRYEVPLLFSNTLNVDDGQKGICAPVRLDHADFPGAIFIRSRIDSLNAHRGDQPLQGISLLTGAFLSARFPFISPSGKMGPGYHFMDGGGKDNSGASTSEAIFISLCRRQAQEKSSHPSSELDSLMSKVRFYFVSITNNPFLVRDVRKMVSNRWEPISPLVGIINSGISGNAVEADKTLQMRYSGSSETGLYRAGYCSVWITGSCVEYADGQWYEPVLPLGWQISEPSLLRLRQSFDSTGLAGYEGAGIPWLLKLMQRK